MILAVCVPCETKSKRCLIIFNLNHDLPKPNQVLLHSFCVNHDTFFTPYCWNRCVAFPVLPAEKKSAPSPLFEALVCWRKGREKLNVWRRGSPQRACLTFSNISWHGSIHWTESDAPFWMRSVMGLVRSAKHGMNQPASPKNCLTSPLFTSWVLGRQQSQLSYPACHPSGSPDTAPPLIQQHTSLGWL